MALLQAMPMILFLLSVTTAEGGTISHGVYDHDTADIKRNLVEPREEISDVTARVTHDTYGSRRSELSLTDTTSTVLNKPQARTLSISSIIGGNRNKEDIHIPSTSIVENIAPLNEHPLWKVHKYQGIDLKPVPLPTAYGPPSESYNPPIQTYGTPEPPPTQPSHSYGPPSSTFGQSETSSSPTSSSASMTDDPSAALSALDNLSGFLNLLPEDGSSSSSSLLDSLSALNSLASILSQKTNTGGSTGLTLDNLSALASLASLLQTKSNGAGASSLGTNSPKGSGVELSSAASLINLFPKETSPASGSLLSNLRRLLSRRPGFLTSLLNTLNVYNPSKSQGSTGVFPRFLNYRKVNPVPIVQNLNTNSPSKFIIGNQFGTLKHAVKVKGKIAKHVGLKNHLSSTLGKLGALGIIKNHLPLKAGKVLKTNIISNLGKLGKLAIIKSKLPLKVAILSKPALLSLALLGKHAFTKNRLPLKFGFINDWTRLDGQDKPLFGKGNIPLGIKTLSTPLKLKRHIVAKFAKLFRKGKLPLKIKILGIPLKIKTHVAKLAKLGKNGISKIYVPFKLIILGKSLGLKGLLTTKLGKLIKLGIIKSSLPLKLLGKSAAVKSHVTSKLAKLVKGVKYIKSGIVAVPVVIKKHIVSKLKKLGKTVALLSKRPTITDIIELKKGKWKFPLKSNLFGNSVEITEDETSRKDVDINKENSILGVDEKILKQIPNFFLGTAPEEEVSNLLDLPDLPPILIPANYKFQETGVGHPYVVKFSKPATLTLPTNPHVSPEEVLPYSSPQQPPPTWTPVQTPQGVFPYPPQQVASAYDVLSPGRLPQDVNSFQTSESFSQQSFDSLNQPTMPYTGSVPEPRNPTNSYGQTTSPYGVVQFDTQQVSSDFGTDSQGQIHDSDEQIPATETSSSSVYSISQQNQIQTQHGGTEFGSYPALQNGPYLQQTQTAPHSGPYPETSRSDTDVSPDDIPSKERGDFQPSSLAAATGAGYSRVVFQRSQHVTEHQDNLPSTQEAVIDLVATASTIVPRSKVDLQSARELISPVNAMTTASLEDSHTNEKNVSHKDTNEFHTEHR